MERRSVFISYRRQRSEHLARSVSNNLREHGFDTFVDLENLGSGEFARTILSQIEAREHFIVLLQPGSLDQIGEDGDWLRREIAHALTHDRNVVPVTADGFEFCRDLVLPPDVARLPSFNEVAIQPGYFDAAMEKLRTRFLKMPPTSGPTPVTEPLQRAPAGRAGKPTGARAPVLPAPQLTGQRENWALVRLSWSKVPGASEYVLEQALETLFDRASGSRFSEVYRGPDRSYDDIRAIRQRPSQLWRYRVRADAFGQAGRWSDTLSL